MDIKEWTSLSMPELLTRAACGKGWRGVSAESSFMAPLMTQLVKGLNWTADSFQSVGKLRKEIKVCFQSV